MRIKRLCSSPSIFQNHLENLKTWFCRRTCPQKVADVQIKRASEKILDELFEKPDKEIGVPLVVTYRPLFYKLSATMRKYFTFLYIREKVKRVFTPTPFVSFRSGYSFRKHLFRAKVYPFIRDIHKGTFCCNVKQTDTFESFKTKKVYKKNHSSNCDSKMLDLPFLCKVFGIKYVGSTVNRFRLR